MKFETSENADTTGDGDNSFSSPSAMSAVFAKILEQILEQK